MSRPRRAAITRPQGRGGALARALAAQGLIPVEVPLIEIRSVPATASLRTALWATPPSLIVLSSASSVPALEAAGGVPAGVWVAAIGPATATALVDAGFDVAVEGDGAGGAALASRLSTLAVVRCC